MSKDIQFKFKHEVMIQGTISVPAEEVEAINQFFKDKEEGKINLDNVAIDLGLSRLGRIPFQSFEEALHNYVENGATNAEEALHSYLHDAVLDDGPLWDVKPISKEQKDFPSIVIKYEMDGAFPEFVLVDHLGSSFERTVPQAEYVAPCDWTGISFEQLQAREREIAIAKATACNCNNFPHCGKTHVIDNNLWSVS